MGKSPQIIHLFIGFSIVFTIHFGGFSHPYFWKHRMKGWRIWRDGMMARLIEVFCWKGVGFLRCIETNQRTMSSWIPEIFFQNLNQKFFPNFFHFSIPGDIVKPPGCSMVVSGSPKRWDRWHSPSPNWQEKYHLYTPYSPCLRLGVKNATYIYLPPFRGTSITIEMLVVIFSRWPRKHPSWT